MTADEFIEWLAEYGLTPWDQQTDSLLANGFAAQLQSWGSKIKPADLMPRWDDGGPEKRAAQERAAAEIFHMQVLTHNRRFAKRND